MPPRACLTLSSLLLVFLLAAAPATKPTFHWAVAGTHAPHIDLASTSIRKDAVVFYEHLFGLIPRFWQGKPERGGIPQNADLNAHLAKLRLDIERAMPGREWEGLGIIDLEAWVPLWSHASDSARDMTRAQVARRHPNRSPADVERIARADYELAARTFLEATLKECRATRPHARWGFYGWPDPAFAPELDKLQYLWDASTAFFPVCYVVYQSDAAGQHQRGTAPPDEFIDDARRRIDICRKVAGADKPVLASVWVRYHDINPVLGGQFLNESDLRTMLDTPLAAGADGFVFWDMVDTLELASQYRAYITRKLAPAITRALKEPRP
jgi:hyaluronoglucosaminidase